MCREVEEKFLFYEEKMNPAESICLTIKALVGCFSAEDVRILREMKSGDTSSLFCFVAQIND